MFSITHLIDFFINFSLASFLNVHWKLLFGCWRGVGFSGASAVKNLPAIQETWVWSLDWEDPLEKGIATHSSILAWKILWKEVPGGPQFAHSSTLAWKIPRSEEPGRLQSMGSLKVRHDWATSLSLHLATKPPPSFFPPNSPLLLPDPTCIFNCLSLFTYVQHSHYQLISLCPHYLAIRISQFSAKLSKIFTLGFPNTFFLYVATFHTHILAHHRYNEAFQDQKCITLDLYPSLWKAKSLSGKKYYVKTYYINENEQEIKR